MVAANMKEPAQEDDSKNIKDKKLQSLIRFKCFLPQSLLFLYLFPAVFFYHLL